MCDFTMLSWYKRLWNDDFIWSTVSTKSSSIFTDKIDIVELLSFNNFKDDDQLWFWIFIIASKFKFLTLELIQEGFNFKLHYLLLCFNLKEVWQVLKLKLLTLNLHHWKSLFYFFEILRFFNCFNHTFCKCGSSNRRRGCLNIFLLLLLCVHFYCTCWILSAKLLNWFHNFYSMKSNRYSRVIYQILIFDFM